MRASLCTLRLSAISHNAMPAKMLTSTARGFFCSVPRQLWSWHLFCHVLLQHVQQLEARLALRLQEAAQRHVSHLDQIKERAAISKEEKEACPPMSPPKTHRGLSCCACCPYKPFVPPQLPTRITLSLALVQQSIWFPRGKCNRLPICVIAWRKHRVRNG